MMAVLLAAILQATVPMRSIDKGVTSNMDAGRQASARSTEEWAALWTLHAGERTRPNVDFSREVVVAVFMGTRPTAGFSVEIVGVRQEGQALIVSYKETRPAPDALTAQVLTSPFHIVAVPRGATTDVKFERVTSS
jgi:hypothetical protein